MDLYEHSTVDYSRDPVIINDPLWRPVCSVLMAFIPINHVVSVNALCCAAAGFNLSSSSLTPSRASVIKIVHRFSMVQSSMFDKYRWLGNSQCSAMSPCICHDVWWLDTRPRGLPLHTSAPCTRGPTTASTSTHLPGPALPDYCVTAN